MITTQNPCIINLISTSIYIIMAKRIPGKSVEEVIDYVVNTINSDPVMEVEYYEIVDGNTLESIKNWSDTDYPVGCITVYCGEVRLIDNIKY